MRKKFNDKSSLKRLQDSLHRQAVEEMHTDDEKKYQEIDEQADEDKLLERDLKLLEEELKRQEQI